MAWSNSILSGCTVCAVIGFSYFLCLNPQELTANATASGAAIFRPTFEKCIRNLLYSYGRRVMGDPAHLFECGRRIHTVKNRRPRHHPFDPGIYNLPNVLRSYATVDLDGEVQAPCLTARRQLPDFVKRIGDKLLAAESGIHAHHQHIVGEV